MRSGVKMTYLGQYQNIVPTSLVFARLPLGSGGCLSYPEDDRAEDPGESFRCLVHDPNTIQMELSRIHDAEFCKIQAATPPPPLLMKLGHRVWASSSSGASKLDRIWQGPFQVACCLSKCR